MKWPHYNLSMDFVEISGSSFYVNYEIILLFSLFVQTSNNLIVFSVCPHIDIQERFVCANHGGHGVPQS